MSFVIQHPARVDLFFDGTEWAPLTYAKQFTSEADAASFLQPGEVVIPTPAKQPTHPLSHTNP